MARLTGCKCPVLYKYTLVGNCGINPVFLFTRQAEELKAGTAADARPFQVYMLDLMYRTPRVGKILAFGGHATDYLMHFPRMYLGNT